MASESQVGTNRAAKNPFAVVPEAVREKAKAGQAHLFRHHRCKTDTLGFAQPKNHSPLELVVDATEGFIPLWERGMTLRWRFREQSLQHFADIPAAKAGIRSLLGQALLAWGDAVPVKFAERQDNWDFELVVEELHDCDTSGCTLAQAFFPDAGRHKLIIYPDMFAQPSKEQVETLAHELGHVFGLRHFFAKISENAWPSELFGTHQAFTIMNYGDKSRLTKQDKIDLKRLYESTWTGELKHINGTEIRLVRPYHLQPPSMVAKATVVAA
jgi:hypothetical protein